MAVLTPSNDKLYVLEYVANSTIYPVYLGDSQKILSSFETVPSTTATRGTANTNTNLLTYQNSTYGISIKYPQDWQIRTNATVSNVSNVVVAQFYSPNEDLAFNVGVDRFDTNKTMNTYVADIIQSYRSDPSFTLLSYTVYNSNLDQPTLAGSPAYDLLSTFNSTTGERFLQHEIGTIVGNQTYYVVYLAPTGRYALYEDLVNQMIDSLEIYPPSSHLPNAGGGPIAAKDTGLM